MSNKAAALLEVLQAMTDLSGHDHSQCKQEFGENPISDLKEAIDDMQKRIERLKLITPEHEGFVETKIQVRTKPGSGHEIENSTGSGVALVGRRLYENAIAYQIKCDESAIEICKAILAELEATTKATIETAEDA